MTDLSFMTDRSPVRPGAPWVLAMLLIAAPLTGCLGNDSTTDVPGEEAFRVFVAATGSTADQASATIGNVGVLLNQTQGTQWISLYGTELDLASLAGSGQAQLAGASDQLDGDAVARTIVAFDELTVGSTTLTDVRVEAPLDYTAGPGVEVTVTIDLDETAAEGEPKLAHLVVEKDGQTVASVTGAELDSPEPKEIPELDEPVIVAKASEGNDTYPSFEINSEISFTIDITETTGASVREVFWSFSDGSTTSGREVTHAFRSAGPHAVNAIVEGSQGQQARANVSLDIYWRTEGDGNVGLGTTGAGVLDGRDTKTHDIEIPGPFTSLSVYLVASPSGGLCSEEVGDCAPSNVHVEILDADGEVVGENSTDENPKWINQTTEAPGFPGGNWTLRVKGDQGAAIGYQYAIEVHYIDLLEAEEDGHDHEHG